MYFITICSFNHERLFGAIDNGDMVLTEYGEIVNKEWLQTGEMRNNITLKEFVIMPNHIHGIIEINDSTRRGTMPRAQVHRGAGSESKCQRAPAVERFSRPTSNTIPTIVRGFK